MCLLGSESDRTSNIINQAIKTGQHQSMLPLKDRKFNYISRGCGFGLLMKRKEVTKAEIIILLIL